MNDLFITWVTCQHCGMAGPASSDKNSKTAKHRAERLAWFSGWRIMKGGPECPGCQEAAAIGQYRPEVDEVRGTLIQADSIMSLVRYRESTGLSEQSIKDLDAAISAVRRLTEKRR
mgnify:CR=1 FL=1